ncbi:hypothetical protein [Micromonospora sp. NPDC049301]
MDDDEWSGRPWPVIPDREAPAAGGPVSRLPVLTGPGRPRLAYG